MKTMDRINQKEGPMTLRVASCGVYDKAWKRNSPENPRDTWPGGARFPRSAECSIHSIRIPLLNFQSFKLDPLTDRMPLLLSY